MERIKCACEDKGSSRQIRVEHEQQHVGTQYGSTIPDITQNEDCGCQGWSATIEEWPRKTENKELWTNIEEKQIGASEFKGSGL